MLELFSVLRDSAKVVEKVIENSGLDKKVKSELFYTFKSNVNDEILEYITTTHTIMKYATENLQDSLDDNADIIFKSITDTKQQFDKI